MYKLDSNNSVNYTVLAEKIKNLGGIVINDKARFEKRTHVFLEREDHGFCITSLFVNKNLETHVSMLPCSWNRRSRYLPIEKAYVLLAEDGSRGVVERYSRAILQISVEDKLGLVLFAESDENGRTIPKRIYRTKDDKFFVESPFTRGYAYDLIAQEEIPLSDVTEDISVLVYNDPIVGCSTTTAGTLKQKALTVACCNLPGFDPWRVWNRMNYNSAAQGLKGKVGSYKEVAQMSTRMSAFEAPAAELAGMNTVAYFMGKFSRKGIGIDGSEEDHEYADGLGFWAAEHAAAAFSSKNDKVLITPSAVHGSSAQMRPHMCKLMAMIVYRHIIAHMINKSGDVVVLYRDKITAEDQEDFNLCFSKEKDKNGKKVCKSSKFWGKVVVVTGSEVGSTDVDFFTDLDGLKATFDLRYQTACNVLGISALHKSVENGSSFSSQVLDSALIFNPEKTYEVVKRHMAEYMDDKMASINYAYNDDGGLEYLDDGEGHPARISDFENESMDIGQMIQTLSPKFSTSYWRPLFKRIVGNAVKGMVTDLSRLKITTSGGYLKAIPDPASWIAGVNVLECLEDGSIDVISTMMLKHKKDKAVGIKFPKMLDREYAKLRAKAIGDYRRKLYELVPDQKARDMVMSVVENLSEGIIVVPAVELLKNMLAGMDFDGDAIQVYIDEDIVDIFWAETPLAVVIEMEEAKGAIAATAIA